jgi:hypothetical protein
MARAAQAVPRISRSVHHFLVSNELPEAQELRMPRGLTNARRHGAPQIVQSLFQCLPRQQGGGTRPGADCCSFIRRTARAFGRCTVHELPGRGGQVR